MTKQVNASAKTSEQRREELKTFQGATLPQEWEKHLNELKPLMGQVALPDGTILCDIKPKYQQSTSSKGGTFKAVVLSKVGARWYQPIANKGFFLVEARVDIIARPAGDRKAIQQSDSQDLSDFFSN